MIKNILTKAFIFSAVLLSVVFWQTPAFAITKDCPEGQEYFEWGQKCLPKCREGWKRDFAGTCQPDTKEAKKELERLEKSCDESEYWSKDYNKCLSRCTNGKKWDKKTKSCVKEESNNRKECDITSPGYESCMESYCMSIGAFFQRNSYLCVHCSKKSRPSNKLQNCVDKDMSEAEEEQKYQEKQAEEAAERERIKASCTGKYVYDEYQNKCRFDPNKKDDTQTNPAEEDALSQSDINDIANSTVGDDVFDEGDASEDGVTEDEGDASDVDDNSYTMTTNTRIDDNGNVSETTDSSTFTVNDAGAAGGTEETGKEAPKVDLSGLTPGSLITNPSTIPSDEELAGLKDKLNTAKAEEDARKQEEMLKQYTGLYNGRQIIPDIMARHCMIKGEEVAKDVSLYVNCIKQYVSEMNSSNAAAKAKAHEEFEILRYKGLLDAAANAMTKSQSVLNYENTMNEYNKADQDMQTEFDDNHALIATMSFVTDVLNSFRELQVEQLKYLAINGIVNVDPAVVLADEEEEKEKEEEKKPASTNSNDKTPEVQSIDVKTTIKGNQ